MADERRSQSLRTRPRPLCRWWHCMDHRGSHFSRPTDDSDRLSVAAGAPNESAASGARANPRTRRTAASVNPSVWGVCAARTVAVARRCRGTCGTGQRGRQWQADAATCRNVATQCSQARSAQKQLRGPSAAGIDQRGGRSVHVIFFGGVTYTFRSPSKHSLFRAIGKPPSFTVVSHNGQRRRDLAPVLQ